MGQVAGPAAGAGQVGLARLGQVVDGPDQRGDLTRMVIGHAGGRTAAQPGQVGADPGQGRQAQHDLDRGGRRQHDPQPAQEYGQVPPELRAGRAQGLLLAGHLDQHDGTGVIGPHATLDHQDAVVERSGGDPRAPRFGGGLDRRLQGLVPQRARARRPRRRRHLPVETAGRGLEARIDGRSRDDGLARRIDRTAPPPGSAPPGSARRSRAARYGVRTARSWLATTRPAPPGRPWPRPGSGAGGANRPSCAAQLVAEAPARLDHLGPDLAPQPHHQRLDGVSVAAVGHAVQLLGQFAGRHGPPRLMGQAVQ